MGIIQKIGIPLKNEDEHHHVFYHLIRSNLKNATLLHIDAHADLNKPNYTKTQQFYDNFKNWYASSYNKQDFPGDKANIAADNALVQYINNRLWIGSFIRSAFRAGVLKDMIWCNPQIYRYRGSRPLLMKMLLGSDGEPYRSEETSLDELCISKENPLILDADDDGYCCTWPVEEYYYGGKSGGCTRNEPKVDGYEQRIIDTCDMLKEIKRPDMILNAESKGIVPEHLVGKVKEFFEDQLRSIYGDIIISDYEFQKLNKSITEQMVA